jgi:hypothetical protein
MKNMENTEILKKYFNFLIAIFNFKIEDIEDHNHALYAKFISNNIGIYFIYEFRDFVPQIQFTKLNNNALKARQGLYTIRELYKDENFKLHSFYLDEILSFKGQKIFKSYFQNVQTIEDAIKISSELVDEYAMDFVRGDEFSYLEIDKWYRTQVNNSIS